MSKMNSRPINSYISSVQELKKLNPKLKKLARRKTLKPWEKAWVARTENAARGHGQLTRITEKQARELKGIDVYGKGAGFRAIHLSNVADGAKVKIKDGKLSVKSGIRNYFHEYVAPPYPDNLIDAGLAIFEKYKNPVVYVQSVSGRLSGGTLSAGAWIDVAAQFAIKYQDVENFLTGIVYLKQNK